MPEIRATYDTEADPARRDRVDRVVDAYEDLMHRVASGHAPELLEVGVTMSQAKVLYLVQATLNVRMSDLSARLGVGLSTVSGMVDRLVEQGLLERSDDPADRRHVVLQITPAGTTQLELFHELSARQIRALLTRVDDADLTVIERALTILADAAAVRPGTALPSTAATGGTAS